MQNQRMQSLIKYIYVFVYIIKNVNNSQKRNIHIRLHCTWMHFLLKLLFRMSLHVKWVSVIFILCLRVTQSWHGSSLNKGWHPLPKRTHYDNSPKFTMNFFMKLSSVLQCLFIVILLLVCILISRIRSRKQRAPGAILYAQVY